MKLASNKLDSSAESWERIVFMKALSLRESEVQAEK